MAILYEPTEYLARETPVTIRRQAKWSECDPAGAVYVVNYFSYVMSASDLFFSCTRAMLTDPAPPMFMTPTKAVEIEFHSPLMTGQACDIEITVASIGSTTWQLRIAGMSLEGVALFTAALTLICVARDGLGKMPLPPAFRAVLEQYATRCRQSGAPVSDVDARRQRPLQAIG
jgi:acyl-CoA thioesterase FadM